MNLIVACAAGALAVLAWRNRLAPAAGELLETIGTFGDDFFGDD